MAIEWTELGAVIARNWQQAGNVVQRLKADYALVMTKDQELALGETVYAKPLGDGCYALPEPGESMWGGWASKATPGLITLCLLSRPSEHKAKVSFVDIPLENNPFACTTLAAALDAVDTAAKRIGGGEPLQLLGMLATQRPDHPTLRAADTKEVLAYIAAYPAGTP